MTNGVAREVHPRRREQLAKIIDDRWHGYGYNPFGAADAIIADGWIKPPDEAQLVVQDEATIERMGKAICATSFPHLTPAYAWDVQFEDGQRHFRELARVALAAAVNG